MHVPGDTSYEGQSYLLVEFLGYKFQLTSKLYQTPAISRGLWWWFSLAPSPSHKVPLVPTNSWAMCRPVWATPVMGSQGQRAIRRAETGQAVQTGHWSLLDFSCGIKDSRQVKGTYKNSQSPKEITQKETISHCLEASSAGTRLWKAGAGVGDSFLPALWLWHPLGPSVNPGPCSLPASCWTPPRECSSWGQSWGLVAHFQDPE